METHQNGQIVYEEDYSCIIEPQNGKGGIFIGNLEAAQNIKTLRKHGIKAILTAAKGVQINHPKSDVPFYLQVQGEDRDNFDLSKFFTQCTNFIRDSLNSTNILVHCLAGVSRSVSLVIAYFIKHCGWSYNEAYSLVKSKRSIIHPNDGFISQLRKLELQMKGTVHTSKRQPTFQSHSISPVKKRYEYCLPDFQESFKNNNPETYLTSRHNKIGKGYLEFSSRALVDNSKSIEKPINKNDYSLKYQPYSQSIDLSSETNKKENSFHYLYPLSNETINKFQSNNKKGEQQFEEGNIQFRYYCPDKSISPKHLDKSEAFSVLKQKNNFVSLNESERLFGNYDGLRYKSNNELNQDLDNKIAAIRQKYSKFCKDEVYNTRNNKGFEPRRNNFVYDNELGSERLRMKKINSEAIGFQSRYEGNFVTSLGRSSIGGLEAKKTISMREGY